MLFNLAVTFTCALIAGRTVAHPGESAEHHQADLLRRSEWLNQVERRDLSHCAEKLKARGLHMRSLQRRRAAADHLRAKRALHSVPYLRGRDISSAANTSHLSTLTGLTTDSTDSTIFSDNSSCILNPEVTEGPYYVLGELVRKDVTESQPGIPLTLDIQIIDTNTCSPIPTIMLDFWHSNSTGVYSGVVAAGNGDSNDPTNLDATFLRGIQKADDDGVVVFDSVFPGHYAGRATHIHIMGHLNASVGANKTLIEQGSIAHVGQIFFDQALLTHVNTVLPYSGNTAVVTLNTDDMIASQAAEDADPFAEYVLLGDSISDGILAWTTIGVNVTANHSVSAAAHVYADGGVANENALSDGGGAPPGGMNGTTGGGNGTTVNGTVAASNAIATSSSTGVVSVETSSSEAVGVAGWYGGVLMALMGVGAVLF